MTRLRRAVEAQPEDSVASGSPRTPVGAEALFAEAGKLAAYVSRHLNVTHSCQVVRIDRKMGCLIAEFELTMEEHGVARLGSYIAKTYEPHKNRGQANFDALSLLWRAGFRIPSPFTVVRPIAFIADRALLVQEKAPGRLLTEILFPNPELSTHALACTAAWLGALHAANVDAEPRIGTVREAVARWGRELAAALPLQAQRIERLMTCALSRLEDSQLSSLLPSHGDFHPMNIFIADNGRVTAVDLEDFGRQEPAADVGYFLAQTAVFGYFRLGDFAATERARHSFLRRYLEVGPPLRRERLALYMGLGLLQALHYQIWVLNKDNTQIVAPWLYESERCLWRMSQF